MDAETYRKIQAFVRKNLIPNLQGEAEDCAQEIAIRSIERPLASWKHLMIDWLRENGHTERGKHGAIALGAQRSEFELEIDRAECPATTPMDGHFDRELVNRLIEGLPERSRQMVELRLADKTQAEIGEQLGITESRVSQVLARAVKVMRERVMRQEELSRAERSVYEMTLKGLSNKEIGAQLFVTEKTVKFHLTKIYAKLGYRSRAEMIASSNGNNVVQQPQGESEMSNWEPMKPLPGVPVQASQNHVAQMQGQDMQRQVEFVVETFQFRRTVDHLQKISEDVVKGDASVEKVLAACQCIGRMNETVQTVIKAAQAMRGR